VGYGRQVAEGRALLRQCPAPRHGPRTSRSTSIYVANQKADTIVQFEINPETGELKPTGQVTPSITPVAMVFRAPG
jgi:6-phosphogluconolactonase (cycloisomerase 2 family)